MWPKQFFQEFCSYPLSIYTHQRPTIYTGAYVLVKDISTQDLRVRAILGQFFLFVMESWFLVCYVFQCDLERAENKYFFWKEQKNIVFWRFSFFTISGPFFMYLNFYIFFRILQVTVSGTGTNYLCLTSSNNTRFFLLKIDLFSF